MLVIGLFSSFLLVIYSLDDANFAVATANAAILSLTTEEDFIRSIITGELATIEKKEEEYNFFVFSIEYFIILCRIVSLLMK